jgi:hypothetical protein
MPPANVRYERMDSPSNIAITQELSYDTYFSDPDRPWRIFGNLSAENLISRMNSSYPPLGSPGIATVLGAATVNEAYKIKPLISDEISETGLKVVNSGTVDRYNMLWGVNKMTYIKCSYLHPIIRQEDETQLPTKRREQARTPKIIVASMTKTLECAVDLEGNVLAGKSTSIIFPCIDIRYLAGLLNSKLVNYYFTTQYSGNKLQGGYIRIGPPQLKTIPIPRIDESNLLDVERTHRIAILVQSILDMNKRLGMVQIASERELLQHQKKISDREINQLVYDLYGLTKEEIDIVEGK